MQAVALRRKKRPPTGKGQKHKERQELDKSEDDFDLVGQNRLVILREKRLHESGPDQQKSSAGDKGDEGSCDRTQALAYALFRVPPDSAWPRRRPA